jgi:SAM-dependent methyltransferase
MSSSLVSDGKSLKESDLKGFRDYLESRIKTGYDVDHKVRYLKSFEFALPYLQQGKRVLELGKLCPITHYLGQHCGCDISAFSEDLRYPIDLKESTFDLIVMLEVLEHLKDRPAVGHSIGEVSTFTFSGVQSVLAECARLLKTDGILFLTTPNITCTDSIGRALLKKHPFAFLPHVREFAFEEVPLLVEPHGFDTVRKGTSDVWEPLPGLDRGKIARMIAESGFDTSDRGDDSMYIFRRV